MYQKIVSMCSSPERASGPAIDLEHFFSTPVYQEDAIDHLTMVPRKKLSRHVSELMDYLGYSYEMIKYRQQISEECDALQHCHPMNICTRVITGSRGEGTVLFYESDVDYMHIIEDAICADNPQDFNHQKNITLFQTERHDTCPGYTRLKQMKTEGRCFRNKIAQSLFELETGSFFLSSQLFTDIIQKAVKESVCFPIKIESTCGPSIPASVQYVKIDNVHCLKCFCPDIVERWVSRPRCHGWPSPDTVREISLLEGHVVPVGFKGSEKMYREWRICYSLSELQLIRNFNQTQLNVYIILKKISKLVLKPVCKDITSYIMKNVILWVSEANGLDRFTPDLLMDRLCDCIKYLRTCVSDNYLQSYMIPERNLLAGGQDNQHGKQLIGLLNDLLHDGGRMILRCDMLRDAILVMYKMPVTFRKFSEKRDNVEFLMLNRMTIKLKTQRHGISNEELNQLLYQNEQYCTIESQITHLIQLNARTLRQMGKTQEEINNLIQRRLTELLS